MPQQPGRAVDLFAQDVGVAGVPLQVHNLVDQDLVESYLRSSPVRDMADGVERQRVDGLVGEALNSAVEIDEAGCRLLCSGVPVGLRVRVTSWNEFLGGGIRARRSGRSRRPPC